MSNLHLVNSHHSDGVISLNETVFNHNLTVNANMSAILGGPITIPNITINGTLIVISELNVTTDLEIETNGTLNVIG